MNIYMNKYNMTNMTPFLRNITRISITKRVTLGRWDDVTFLVTIQFGQVEISVEQNGQPALSRSAVDELLEGVYRGWKTSPDNLSTVVLSHCPKELCSKVLNRAPRDGCVIVNP